LTHAVAALLLSFLAPGDGPPGATAAPALRPLAIEAGPRRGGGQPLRAHGFAPAALAPAPRPCVVVVAASDAPPARQEAWLAALAQRGYPALALELPVELDAGHCADAVTDALRQLRAVAAFDESPSHREIDPRRLVLVAEGDRAAAAARAAADERDLDALLLLDPAAQGSALPWLHRIDAFTALVASGAPHAATVAAWHQASRGDLVRRCTVEFAGETALPRVVADDPAAAPAERPVLEREVRRLIVDFVECALPPPVPSGPRSFADRARRGAIDRRVHSTDDRARLALTPRAD